MLYRFDASLGDLRVILFLGSGLALGFFSYPFAIFSFALQFDTLFIGLGVIIVVGFWSSLGLTLVLFFILITFYVFVFFCLSIKVV